MRKILLLIGLIIIPTLCLATEPYPDQTSTTIDKKTIVRLTSRRGFDTAITIETVNGKIIKSFTDEEILSDDDIEKYNYTTAGNDWYQNSISFITKNNDFFVFRTRWGKIIVIDLTSNTLLSDIPSEAQEEIKNTMPQKAMILLTSLNPEDRQTGAIICGQLKLKKAIPLLKQLLKDESWYTSTIGNEQSKIIFYVRKAAKEALENLGIKVEDITIELNEKDHLRYDPEKGRYIVIE